MTNEWSITPTEHYTIVRGNKQTPISIKRNGQFVANFAKMDDVTEYLNAITLLRRQNNEATTGPNQSAKQLP